MLLIESGFPLPEVNFSLLSPSGRELYRARSGLASLADRASSTTGMPAIAGA